jgi:HK97 family phage major capsid protein
MKKTYNRISLALLAFIGLALFAGIIPVVTGIVALVCVQSVAFAIAAPQRALFNTVMTPEQIKEFGEILDSLKEYKTVFPSLKGLDFEQLKGLPAGFKTVNELVEKMGKDMDALRRAQIAEKQNSTGLRRMVNGQVQISDGLAKHLGALVFAAGLRGGQIAGTKAEHAENLIKSVFDAATFKTALTSSDIPLPVGYSGEVAELVGMFGAARQYATVFPLGDGVVKLPRLGTDPAFGLIASSGTVTEKSPTTVWVTFTAEKFGGLVRMPSEIDEDSIVAMGQFLARYAARQMAYIEDYQVFRSTGAGSATNGTAEGLTKNVVTDSKTVASGVLGSPSEFTLAHIRSIRKTVDAAALRMGAYYMHPSFESLLASLNTAGDKPYQANGLGGATLDGFPIRWIDVMPVLTTADVVSTVHILFGDISFQYLGVKGGMRFDTSKEAGFTTDEILVRALERLTTGKMALGCMSGLITHSA